MSSLNPVHYLKGLSLDYYTDFEKVGSYFARDYRKIKVEPRKISDEVIRCIELYNREIKAGSRVFENIEKLKEVPPIVTGQQPCLLTGPLYVIYKALTAIILAERMHTAAVFWNASEDDDTAEVNHIWVMNSQLEKICVELEPHPFSKIRVKKEDIDHVATYLSQVTPPTEFREDILNLVASCSDSFSEMFSQLLSRFLEEYGLIMVEPHIFAELAIPVYQKLIIHPTRAVQIVNAAGDVLEKNGYRRQVHKQEDTCSFYILFDDSRYPVFYDGCDFSAGETTFTEKELMMLLDQDPERFTSTVISRPLIQDFLFFTAGYCAGPGEISYFAQMKDVYTYFDIEEPPIIPRFGATLIEKKVQKILGKYTIDVTDLRDPDYILKALAKKDIEEVFSSRSRQILSIVEELQDYMTAVDGNLKKTGARIKTQIARELHTMEEKTAASLKNQNHITEAQISKAAHNIFPNNLLQERVLNVVQYLIRYESLLQGLHAAFCNAQPGEHVFVNPGD